MVSRTYTADELNAWEVWFHSLEDSGPYHSPEYLDLLAGNFEYNTETPELFIYESGDSFVYYPYIRRPLDTVDFDTNRDLSAHSDIVSSWYYGGPLFSGTDETIITEFVDSFSEYCKEERIVAEFVRFDPNIRNHADFSCLEPVHNRQTVPVHLTKSKDKIWDEYEGRNQRAIRQAKESALVIDRQPDMSDLSDFHSIYMSAMAARDASEHYRFSQQFFEQILDTSLFSLVVARYDGTVVGGFIIAHDDTYSHHYLSASNPEYWDYRVNNLMYHDVVMYMHETGRKIFDFQGGRPGVFKFKKGFSPDRGQFHIGQRTHLPEIYDELVEAAGEAGIDTDSGYFPAYRIEQSN